jgi:predicted transcriptional regulator
MDQQLDALTAQLHEWTESALSLDEGHFPRELLNELEDILSELKTILDESASDADKREVTEQFVNPEMAEVVERFPKVRRVLERALGTEFMEQLAEEAEGFGVLDDDED